MAGKPGPVASRLADVASSPAPSSSTLIGATLGTGLGIIAVWLIELTTGATVPAPVAAAIGNVAGQLLGYFFPGGTRADTQ